MRNEQMTRAEFARLLKGYERLIDWVQINGVDGQETLSLLLKAAGALAVVNDLPKEQLMEVLSATYDMEAMVRTDPAEMH